MKPRLLYVSPVMPAATGTGTAMRAALVLRGLAQCYRVSLLVVPLYRTPGMPADDEVARVCERIVQIPLADGDDVLSPVALMVQAGTITPSVHPVLGAESAEIPALCADPRFDVVHVFRLSAVPFAGAYLTSPRSAPALHLDLDDIESLTAERLADLYQANGHNRMAMFHRVFARRLQALEADCCRQFDRVYVCSESDRARLQPRSEAPVSIIPNGVSIGQARSRGRADEPFTFLFVGTLGYYPNVDALEYFCTRILPLIRDRASQPFQVNIVGSGAVEPLAHLARLSGVHLVGSVPDIAPWYAAADAVIVPIRGGGGTRIKILEAFAHRVPVVSTRIGIEGIDARDNEHALLGDAPDEFAACCLRLMDDQDLRARLAATAFALVERAYSEAEVLRRIRAVSELDCVTPK